MNKKRAKNEVYTLRPSDAVDTAKKFFKNLLLSTGLSYAEKMGYVAITRRFPYSSPYYNITAGAIKSFIEMSALFHDLASSIKKKKSLLGLLSDIILNIHANAMGNFLGEALANKTYLALANRKQN